MIRYAKNMGFRPRVLFIHDHEGRVKLSKAALEVFQKIQKMIPKGLTEISNYRQELIEKGEAPFKCRAGSRFLYVDEFGVVNWCSQTRGAFKKDLMSYCYEDLSQQFYTHKSCQDKCTLGCVRSASAVDGWRLQHSPQFQDSPVVEPAALLSCSTKSEIS